MNVAHQFEYNEQSIRLKVAAHDYGVDSPQFREARDAAKLALSHFTRFGS